MQPPPMTVAGPVDGAGGGLFIERGRIGDDAVVNDTITISLRDGSRHN